MTTLLSTPTTLTITTPGTSALATLAAAMAPGTWAQLAANNVSALVDPTTSSIPHVLTYTNKAAWDPLNRRVHIIGSGHGGSALRYVRYDEATNAFSFVDAAFPASHGFDHITVNPPTGEPYVLVYYTLQLWRRGPSGWVQLPNRPSLSYQNITWVCDWWTGALSGLTGSQGAFMFFSPNSNGQVSWFDPVANSWIASTTGWQPDSPGSQYHSVGAYSPRLNVAVGGGGNAFPNSMWRVNADRSVVKLSNTPFNYGIQMGRLVNDPATGRFLVYSTSGFYEVNPAGSGTYTPLTGSRTPPANVGLMSETNGWGAAAVAIPQYGVTMWISMQNTTGYVHLYKHA
jgi:hypothetical protein